MSYARVISFEYKPNTMKIYVQKMKSGLLPLLQKTPGFLSYCNVQGKGDSGIAIGTWETREQAEAATRQAAQWLTDNVGDIAIKLDTFVGEVLVEQYVSTAGAGRPAGQAEAARPEVRH